MYRKQCQKQKEISFVVWQTWQNSSAAQVWAQSFSLPFQRVLPFESEVNLTNFHLSWENGEVL